MNICNNFIKTNPTDKLLFHFYVNCYTLNKQKCLIIIQLMFDYPMISEYITGSTFIT